MLTSVALSAAQSLTQSQAACHGLRYTIMTIDWRSFHELEQLAQKVELLHRSSSCLELTAASPSLPVFQSQSVSSRAQDSSFQFSGWRFTDFSSENY